VSTETVLQHVVSAEGAGDLVFAIMERAGQHRLALRRIGPTGGTTEIRLRLDEVGPLLFAAAEFRQRVAPPRDEPRRRGAR